MTTTGNLVPSAESKQQATQIFAKMEALARSMYESVQEKDYSDLLAFIKASSPEDVKRSGFTESELNTLTGAKMRQRIMEDFDLILNLERNQTPSRMAETLERFPVLRGFFASDFLWSMVEKRFSSGALIERLRSNPAIFFQADENTATDMEIDDDDDDKQGSSTVAVATENHLAAVQGQGSPDDMEVDDDDQQQQQEEEGGDDGGEDQEEDDQDEDDGTLIWSLFENTALAFAKAYTEPSAGRLQDTCHYSTV